MIYNSIDEINSPKIVRVKFLEDEYYPDYKKGKTYNFYLKLWPTGVETGYGYTKDKRETGKRHGYYTAYFQSFVTEMEDGIIKIITVDGKKPNIPLLKALYGKV